MERLATTLEAYLRNSARLRPTAIELGLHENTIKNRIQAVADALSGPFEPRAAAPLVALQLAPLVR